MTTCDLFVVAAAALAAGLTVGLAVYACWRRAPGHSRIVFRDPVVGQDQYHEQRRMRLVSLQEPAAKGFDRNRDTRRHTVLAYKERWY